MLSATGALGTDSARCFDKVCFGIVVRCVFLRQLSCSSDGRFGAVATISSHVLPTWQHWMLSHCTGVLEPSATSVHAHCRITTKFSKRAEGGSYVVAYTVPIEFSLQLIRWVPDSARRFEEICCVMVVSCVSIRLVVSCSNDSRCGARAKIISQRVERWMLLLGTGAMVCILRPMQPS